MASKLLKKVLATKPADTTEPDDEVVRFYIGVGERLRKVRNTLGLTQSQLGARLGLTRTSVVNIEQGRQRFYLHYIWLSLATLDVPEDVRLWIITGPTEK